VVTTRGPGRCKAPAGQPKTASVDFSVTTSGGEKTSSQGSPRGKRGRTFDHIKGTFVSNETGSKLRRAGATTRLKKKSRLGGGTDEKRTRLTTCFAMAKEQGLLLQVVEKKPARGWVEGHGRGDRRLCKKGRGKV